MRKIPKITQQDLKKKGLDADTSASRLLVGVDKEGMFSYSIPDRIPSYGPFLTFPTKRQRVVLIFIFVRDQAPSSCAEVEPPAPPLPKPDKMPAPGGFKLYLRAAWLL